MNDSVEKLLAHVTETIEPVPAAWPGGWPDDAELALIDAVFSVRARYGDRDRGTGVIGVVQRWRTHREGHADDLRELARTPDSALQEVLANDGVISGRRKFLVVKDAASRLSQAGIWCAADVRRDPQRAQVLYRDVRGLGKVTWSYFQMLLGVPDVKPDVWVLRFLADATGRTLRPSEAAVLLHEVARKLDVDVTHLDHAIWSYQRSR